MVLGFKKKKKGLNESIDSSNEMSRTLENRGKKKSFFNTKQRRKTLISQIKLSQSVPSTIIDAVNGSNDFINSENDFVRVQHLTIDDHDYIPIFAIDERGLESIQIQTPANKEIFGQLSTGLKTSSGSSGFLPIATTESLSDNVNPFFGILPMHDAFQVLEDFEIFDHCDEGWAVALLSIDQDILDLKLCENRYSLTQWISFLNDQCSFIVSDGRVLMSEEIPTTSDVFSLSSEEIDYTKGDNVLDASSENGFTLDDFDVLPEENDSVVVKDTSHLDQDSNVITPVVDATSTSTNDSPDTDIVLDVESEIPHRQADVENKSNASSDDNSIEIPSFERVSEDEFNAEKITMDAQVTTMNNLKISISDQDFVRSCLDPLQVPQFPMLNDSNDPTGRIAQENTLRSECNEALKSMVNSEKANLRQWFEMNRSGLLNSLRYENLNKGKQTKVLFDKANELRDVLSDGSRIRTKAETQILSKLDQLDFIHNESLKQAEEAALAEVRRQYNERKQLIRKEKDDLIAQEEVNVRQQISSEIASTNKMIQDVSQAAASAGYEKIIQQASIRYGVAQQTIDSEYQALMNRISLFTRRSRDEENKRVSDQADIARNDTTVASLNQELEAVRRSHETFTKTQKEEHDKEMSLLKERLTMDYESDLKAVRKQLDNSREMIDKIEKSSEDRLVKRESELISKIEELRDENTYNQNKYERSIKSSQRTAWTIGAIVVLVAIIGSFVIGLLYSQNKQAVVEDNGSSNQPQVIYIDGKDGQTSNSSSTSKDSETNKTSNSESTNK